MSEKAQEQGPYESGYLPRLVGRLSVVPTEGGLVVYSASRRLVFKTDGPGSVSLIRKLLPVLDGNHEYAAISSEIGVGERDLKRVLGTFERAGLLEWDRNGQRCGFPRAHVRDYVSGSLISRSAYENSHQLSRMFAKTSVILACDSEISELASIDLRQIGLGSVVTAPTADDVVNIAATRRRVFANRLVVCQDDCGDRRRFDSVLKSVTPESWPVLRYQMCPHRVEIGPLFTAGYPCCLRCFRSAPGHPCASLNLTGVPDGNLTQEPSFVAALLVDRLVSTLVGDGSMHSWGRIVQTVTAEDVVSSTKFAVVPDVRCAECGWALGHGTGAADVTDVTQSALTSECLAEPSYGLHVDDIGLVRGLAAARSAPPECATSPVGARDDPALRYSGHLPSAVFDRTVLAAVPGDRVSARRYEQHLSAALLSVAGDALEQSAADGESNRKGLAKGEPVTLYLLAPSGTFAIPGSIFRYEHRACEIVSVSTEPQSIERYRDAVVPCEGELRHGPDWDGTRRCLAMIFVGTGSSSLEPEYVRAWRLAHLRTGYALNALASFARSAGVGLFARAVADQPVLADMLELWPGREVITAVVEIRIDAGGRECH
jgi:hypothetical protein